MHFLRVTADLDAASGLAPALDALNAALAETSPFDQRDYGPGIKGIAVVLVCQRAEVEVKRRVRLARSDQRLFLDVIFDFAASATKSKMDRIRWVLDRLAEEVPATVDSFALPAFDDARFREEFVAWCAAFPIEQSSSVIVVA